MLIENFDAGNTIPEIANLFGRSQGAIRSRLHRCGRLKVS